MICILLIFRFWIDIEIIIELFVIDTQSTSSIPPYPVLPNVMTASTDSLRQQPVKHVRVLHN